MEYFRQAWRSLRKAPGFTLASAATLSLGIAVLAGIANIYYGVYLRPLPFTSSDRLRAIGEYVAGGPRSFSSVRASTIAAIKARSRAFEDIAAIQIGSASLGLSEPRRLVVARVDGEFPRLFDLRPTIGRFLGADEARSNERVATISDALFRSQFGGDSNIVGRTILLDDEPHRITGVVPGNFRFPARTDVWLPLSDSTLQAPDQQASVVARLRFGVSGAQAAAELAVIAKQLQEEGSPAPVLALRDEALDRRGQSFMPQPAVLIGAATLALIAALANVSNLAVARVMERRAELALRAAVGASPSALVGLLLAESFIVAVLAMTLGGILAGWAVRLGLAMIPDGSLPFWMSFDPDWRIIAGCIGLTVLATGAIGASAAVRVAATQAVGTLRTESSTRSPRNRGARIGVAVQVALVVILFVGAALIVRSQKNLLNADLGYPASAIAKIGLFRNSERQSGSELGDLAEELLPVLDRMPGVEGSASRALYRTPRRAELARGRVNQLNAMMFLDGDSVTDRSRMSRPRPRSFVVSDSYFAVLGLAIREGRSFFPSDRAASTPVAIVSQAFAKAAWGKESPIGHRVKLGSGGETYTVVGVVDDVRDLSIESDGVSLDPRADLYVSSRQASGAAVDVLMRTRGNVMTVRDAGVSVVRRFDSRARIGGAPTLSSDLEQFVAVGRAFAVAVGAFALVGLVIAIMGLVALVSNDVHRRTSEMGIRMALGATRFTLVRMILAETTTMLLAGLGIGIGCALALANTLSFFLYNVGTFDLRAYAWAVGVITVVGISAATIPIWRSSGRSLLDALKSY